MKDVLYLSDLPVSHNAVLSSLLSHCMNFNGSFALNRSLKKMIEKEINKAESTVNNTISDLVRAEILIRKDVGLYMFNPHLFGQGKWDDIKQLRLEINYNLEGKTFKTAIERKSKGKNKVDESQMSMDDISPQIFIDSKVLLSEKV